MSTSYNDNFKTYDFQLEFNKGYEKFISNRNKDGRLIKAFVFKDMKDILEDKITLTFQSQKIDCKYSAFITSDSLSNFSGKRSSNDIYPEHINNGKRTRPFGETYQDLELFLWKSL